MFSLKTFTSSRLKLRVDVQENTVSAIVRSTLSGTLLKKRKYTAYAYEDFPESLPLELTQPVELLTSETRHYSLTHDPLSDNEWFYTSPHEQGVVRIGPQNRTFFITMFHEMHCLRYFRNILTDRTDADWPHVQHCFNMLRQWTLCAPDLTLESGDFMQRDFENERVGERHACRDWEAIYDWETGEWAHWYKYLKTHNITG